MNLDFSITRSRKKSYEGLPDRFICIRHDRRFDLIPYDDKDSLFPISVRLIKIDLTSGPEFPAELDRVLGITDGVIRSLVTLRAE